MKIALFFGGKSCEHDISIITAIQAMGNIPKLHECIPVYINNEGRWLVGKNFDKIETFRGSVHGKEVHMRPASPMLYSARGKKLAKIDAAIICNHGMGGEDGTLAGVLELAGIPYTGSNLRASAVGMDKITLKHTLKGLNIPVTKYIGIDKYEYSAGLVDITQKIKDEFAFPLIVKPSNLGSSIGISLAHNFVDLICALTVAFEWDTRVIIEEALTDFTELNCAVLGYGDDFIVSEVEQPLGWKDFLTFKDKYEGGFKGTSFRKFPAELSPKIRKEVRDLALATFRGIDAGGVARIDFLLKDDKLYVNEINTVPGSLSNYLFSPDITFSELLDKMLNLAIAARRDKDSLSYTFKRENLFKETKAAGKLKL